MVRRLALLALVPLAFVLASCGTNGATTSTIDLQGVWSVTPSSGTAYGGGGTTTVEFGAASSGLATYLSQSSDSGVTTCEQQIYAALSNNVVLLDGTYYQASAPSANQLVLDDGLATVTLDRVTGTPPVTACTQGTATVLKTLPNPVNYWSTLNAVGTKLYYNSDTSPNPIIAYDTSTGTLGAGRDYTMSVSGGTHRFVVAARTNDLFYGQCACGGSNTLDYFNLSTNTSNTHIDTDADLGVPISIRFGYYTGSSVIIGGRSWNDSSVNQLLTLNQDTLALSSTRQILKTANVVDITMRGSDMLALVSDAYLLTTADELVNDEIVVVGSSGTATKTYKLSGVPPSLTGIAAIGSTVYAIGNTAAGDGVIYQLTLP